MTNVETVVPEPLPNPYLENEVEIEALRASVVAGVGTFSILLTDPSLQAASVMHWVNYFLAEVGREAIAWELCNAVRLSAASGMTFPEAQPHPLCSCPIDHAKVTENYNQFIASAVAGGFEKAVVIVQTFEDDDLVYLLSGWVTRLGDAIAGVVDLPR